MDNFLILISKYNYNINKYMARPTKIEAIAKQKRDDLIFFQNEKGYPLDYIASFHNLTKGRIVQILKKSKKIVSSEV